MGSPLSLLRFLNAIGGDGSGPAQKGVREERDVTLADGTLVDLYEPAGRCAQGAVVAVHGVTLNSRRDPRLMQFARALAASGRLCVVPTLDGLAACEFVERDLSRLTIAIEFAYARSAAQVALAGFSYGGSYALVVAAHEAVRTRLDYVFSVGAYHSLAALLAHFRTEGETAAPTRVGEREHFVYARLSLAYGFRRDLGLALDLVAEMEALLRSYCDDDALETKRRFYEQHLRRLDIFEYLAKHVSPGVLAALSPAGRLARIACPVGLAHAVDDDIVPAGHARLIAAELAGRPHLRHACVVTPLLTHVTPSGLLRHGVDLPRLASLLRPLVA